MASGRIHRFNPYQPLTLEPGVAMLHYGQTVFDGYKVFRGLDGEARIFRPDMNARRLLRFMSTVYAFPLWMPRNCARS